MLLAVSCLIIGYLVASLVMWIALCVVVRIETKSDTAQDTDSPRPPTYTLNPLDLMALPVYCFYAVYAERHDRIKQCRALVLCMTFLITWLIFSVGAAIAIRELLV